MRSAESASGERFDTARKFVRVTALRPDGFVEFEFAVGEPELFLEMILGPEAFEEFCAAQQAEILPTRSPAPDEPSDWEWRLADARQTPFK